MLGWDLLARKDDGHGSQKWQVQVHETQSQMLTPYNELEQDRVSS